jgi:hypothetical protein
MTDLTKSINVYDSEINEIHRVLEILRRKAESPQSYQAFQDEVIERFHDIGFVVDVRWYDTNVEGVLLPEINIQDRVDKNFLWDPNQQVHEVTGDLLSLGDGGVIKSSGLILPPGHKH